MNKKTKIIILSVIAVLIVIVLSVSISTAFMKPVEQGGNLTEISLSSCAKIKLTGTSSVNLSNSYPMSRNKGLQTTPYNFTVTSYCDSYTGFNLYIVPLSTNTLADSNIRYILTNKGSQTVLEEGILSSATNGFSDFNTNEKTELNTGLKGTYGSIYNIYTGAIPLKGSGDYSLYLFVDESATNTVMGKTFKAGVAVKSTERTQAYHESCSDNTLACHIAKLYSGSEANNTLYYHDFTLSNGAEDNSYRFAGASDSVNNFVCFGSDEATCPTDNLYRIIGVIDGKVKLIKYDYATSALLGTDGDYDGSDTPNSTYYKGCLTSINTYRWNYNAANGISNVWSTSLLNKTNLNTNLINNIGSTWASKIATTTWQVGGGTFSNLIRSVPSLAYQYEIGSNAESTTYKAKIGLMYVSDYYYAASPNSWTLAGYNSDSTKDYRVATSNNWMYMGEYEWTLSRISDTSEYVIALVISGETSSYIASGGRAVRPVFSLESTVTYVSGSGTQSDPIRMN